MNSCHINLWTNTLMKGMNSLIPQLWVKYYYNCSSTSMASHRKVDMSLKEKINKDLISMHMKNESAETVTKHEGSLIIWTISGLSITLPKDMETVFCLTLSVSYNIQCISRRLHIKLLRNRWAKSIFACRIPLNGAEKHWG